MNFQVFLDCEFTDLAVGAELLSIALVDHYSDRELYIVISDADRERSSAFVREGVLPLIERHTPEVLSRKDAAARITQWLDELRVGADSRRVVALADSDWDWDLLVQLQGADWPQIAEVVGCQIQETMSPSRLSAFFMEVDAYHLRHQEHHHALVDARALKSAWLLGGLP
ncbi:MAG TPA: hypothetical protein VI279_02730 [Rhodocyclaceae bacterium]